MNYFQITLLLLMLGLGGCVERYISITTKPAGAIVWLNDEEVGATPVTVPFTWYGEYEVVVRQAGYKTLKTSRQAEALARPRRRSISGSVWILLRSVYCP